MPVEASMYTSRAAAVLPCLKTTYCCVHLDNIVYVVFKTIPITRVLGARPDDTPHFHGINLELSQRSKSVAGEGGMPLTKLEPSAAYSLRMVKV